MIRIINNNKKIMMLFQDFIVLLFIMLFLQIRAGDAAQRDLQPFRIIGGFNFFVNHEEKAESMIYKCIGKQDLLVILPQSETLSNVEDINNDGMIELWTVYYDGQENIVRLYQIKIEKNCDNLRQTALNHQIELELDSFSIDDIDKDGKKEILVKTYTHPLYGTPYSKGKVAWVDIYDLSPALTLANSKYRFYFHVKKKEIESEIEKLLLKKKHMEKLAITFSAEEVYMVQINEILDQLRVYETWLQKIEAMQEK